MNPRIPYNPKKRRGPNDEGSGCARLLWLLMPMIAVGAVWAWRSWEAPAIGAGAGTLVVTATPRGIVTVTPGPPTEPGQASATPVSVPTEIPLPTSTLLPAPSPSPTALMTPAATQFYQTQSGDTLPALAARFGVNPADIVAPAGLRGTTTLAEDQLLVIPNVLGPVGPSYRIVPDSEAVYSGAAAGFDPQEFAEERGGYLARYRGYADGRTVFGGDVVLVAARDHSINPRLLMALLEYLSGWVTNPNPSSEALEHPYGFVHDYLTNLNAQLTWATSQVAIGYYGWREGSLTQLTFTDGSTVRLDPNLNAGTVAVQYFLAQVLERAAWETAVTEAGFAATYAQLFGDPFARELSPLLPADLQQVPMALPWAVGGTWSYTGGPHGAWELGGAQAALDFAPGSTAAGCSESSAWVMAVAAGLVLRSTNGAVVVDLDGDGREATGWVVLYLHIATKDRVAAGTLIEKGQRVGHPSCEGGRSTGTHVHIARKYNGEWIPAYGPVPFNLSGWVAGQGKGEYFGTLTREGQVVEACTCSAAWTAITHRP
jgi:murein DD-endopeptidase MepM/ murein hydrolase activator NlpD